MDTHDRYPETRTKTLEPVTWIVMFLAVTSVLGWSLYAVASTQ